MCVSKLSDRRIARSIDRDAPSLRLAMSAITKAEAITTIATYNVGQLLLGLVGASEPVSQSQHVRHDPVLNRSELLSWIVARIRNELDVVRLVSMRVVPYTEPVAFLVLSQ